MLPQRVSLFLGGRDGNLELLNQSVRFKEVKKINSEDRILEILIELRDDGETRKMTLYVFGTSRSQYERAA
jgi:hypothetical protein